MKIHVLLENTTVDPSLIAEHGLSLYIETSRHKLLFDAGQSSAFAENAARMGVDLLSVDIAVLSHGHYDHGGGLARFLALNDRAPVYLSRYAFLPLYNAAGKYIGLDSALAGEKRLVFVGDELRLDEELSLFSCNHSKRVDASGGFGLRACLRGEMIPDDFRHEQYLLVCDGGRRVLFSGCSHKGILNIVRWFEPDVLVGGFHFMKLDPGVEKDRARLEFAARELLRHPTMYYTGHCTGGAQYEYLKGIMGKRLEALSTGRVLEL